MTSSTGQIKQDESLFTYKDGESTATFSNASFTPMFADEIKWPNADLEEEAKKKCGDNAECLFDTASTGDLKYGEATKNTATVLQEEKKLSGKITALLATFFNMFKNVE